MMVNYVTTTIIGVPSNRFNVTRRKLLLLLIVLCCVVVFVCVSFFVCRLRVDGYRVGGGVVVFVGSEGELVRAVDGAELGVSTVVVLKWNVFLSESLVVGGGKNVTLVSGGLGFLFFRLFGPGDRFVVVVEEGGWLCVDGVVITHPKFIRGVSVYGLSGGGVLVREGGEFVLVRGIISGNSDGMPRYSGCVGGGVVNLGVFRMFGGEVSNNEAVYLVGHHGVVVGFMGVGGGVYNGGVFEMFGGSIVNNVAGVGGGGVFNDGNFVMSGGLIAKNTLRASHYLCGGGGVYNPKGDFVMSGGLIIFNTAFVGGGVCSASSASIVLRGGVVVFNLSKNWGSYNVDVLDKNW